MCEIHEYCSLNGNDCIEGMRFPPRFYLPTVKAEHMISGRGLYKYSLPPHLENPCFLANTLNLVNMLLKGCCIIWTLLWGTAAAAGWLL